jgi:hypothetical protein
VKKQKTPPDAGTRALLAATCMGLGAACASTPQARPLPPPEPCPAGALEAMTSLGIEGGLTHGGGLPEDGRTQTSLLREGPITLRVLGPWSKLPGNSQLSGRLYFGEQRIYGRFTEVVTPQGDSFPVCIVMEDPRGGYGVRRGPAEGPGTSRVYDTVIIISVRRFE